jgi:hypothetical protein
MQAMGGTSTSHTLTASRAVVGVLGYVSLFAVLLFFPAGTLSWRAAWLLLAVLLVAQGTSTMLLYRGQRALLDQRSRMPLQPGQATADRVLLPAFMASFAGVVAFSSWDVWRGTCSAYRPHGCAYWDFSPLRSGGGSSTLLCARTRLR